MNEEVINETLLPLNCSGCLNEWCMLEEDYEVYKRWISVDTFEMVLIALNIIVFLAGIVGNLLVIIAVTTTKSMQSVTNIFIVNLAMADMLVMLFCAPPSVIWDVTSTWIFGDLMCRIVIYIQDISVSVSVLTLTFIAYDRYNAICRPLKFSTRKTKAAVVIAVIWTISSVIGIPDAVTLHLDTPMNKIEYPCMADDILFDLSRCSPTWNDSVDFSFTIVKGILLYTLPLIFMSIAYYFIVKTLWRRNNIPNAQEATITADNTTTSAGNNAQDGQNNAGSISLANGHGKFLNRTCNTTIRFVSRKSENDPKSGGVTTMNSASRNLDNQLKTRRKVAKMLIAVVIMFSINFFPVHFLPVLQFIVDKTVHEESDAKENWTLFFQTSAIITHCLCYFNSAINPIIYYFMSAQFKAQYRRILSCQCTADSPQVDYGRYLASRGQTQHHGGRRNQEQQTQHTRISTIHGNSEGISLRELQRAPPPSRPKGRDQQRVPVVVNACMEQPIKDETEPFLQPASNQEGQIQQS